MTFGKVGTYYDRRMGHDVVGDYYGQSGFYNFGYWLEETRSQKEACENLMEKLLAFIPEKKGAILDVACGMGGTTRHLLKYYSATDVVGINISARQLERSRLNAPGCQFILMDATRLGFGSGLFDNMICVESVFHFHTRERFLHEACRVLKPGGYLVLSDILLPGWAGKWNPHVPEKNSVTDLEEFRNVYLQAGFQEVEVVDATNECWREFRQHLARWAWEKLLAREVGVRAFGRGMLRLLAGTVIIRHYLLVSARKA